MLISTCFLQVVEKILRTYQSMEFVQGGRGSQEVVKKKKTTIPAAVL